MTVLESSMKSLTKDDSLAEMISFFTQIETNQSEVVIWQLDKETNKRKIHPGRLIEFGENDNLDFKQLEDHPFEFSEDDVYFYVERNQLIFKCKQQRNDDIYLSVLFPDEVKVLDKNEANDLAQSFVEVDKSLKKCFPIYTEEVIKVKGYDFESEAAPDKENPYMELNSAREKIETEYMVHDTVADKIVDENMTHETTVDHLEHKGLDGFTATGADQVGGSMGGHAGTENLSSTMGGSGSTDKISSYVAAKTSTEKISTKEKAGFKGTDQVSTKERVKNLEVDETSERDKAIFEEELSFVSLDAEDQFYADKRDAPRAKPKEGKTVLMRRESDPENSEAQRHPLFDLSRGGLGAMVEDENYYEKSQVVFIMGFDKNILDEPMRAVVRSIREADEPGKFKLGMQFQTLAEALSNEN